MIVGAARKPCYGLVPSGKQRARGRGVSVELDGAGAQQLGSGVRINASRIAKKTILGRRGSVTCGIDAYKTVVIFIGEPIVDREIKSQIYKVRYQVWLRDEFAIGIQIQNRLIMFSQQVVYEIGLRKRKIGTAADTNGGMYGRHFVHYIGQ
jgi:hypothetical protein